MRRFNGFLVAGLIPLALAVGARAGGPDQPGKLLLEPPAHSCGQFGTSVNFVSTPSEAGQIARREEKLVFVLHVSGHFEDPKFT